MRSKLNITALQTSKSPSSKLVKGGLRLATIPKVSREAFTKPSAVIALTTSGAVASHGIAVTFKRIGSRWALNQAAVWATEAIVALATITVLGVPGTVVFSSNILIYVKWNVVFCEFLKTLAKPWPLQSPGHAVRRQPSPLNPGKHSHSPVLRSHLPLPEHSNFCLWSLSSCGAAAHAYPDGQVRKEQSAPVHAATVEAVAYSWFVSRRV